MTEQSDTPRTDAFENSDESLYRAGEPDWKRAMAFARDLEVELSEAKRELENVLRYLA